MEKPLDRACPSARILLVEDSAADRKILRRFLQGLDRYRFDFMEADTADDALELCRQQAPDCIILDFKLPGRDGLKSLPDFLAACPAPVIFITGQSQALTVTEAYRRGALRFLSKDTLTSATLQDAVLDALEQD